MLGGGFFKMSYDLIDKTLIFIIEIAISTVLN
jgi:hypothetical protein